jgi:type IV secretory pathway VirB9-like protein
MAAPRYDRSPSNGLPNPQLLSGSGNQPMNYRYTFSGPQTAAPVKIYDDGRTTYFKYNNSVIPKIAVITAKGEQLAVPTRTIPGNTVAVDIVAPRYSLSQPGGQVIVYNEANGA